MGFAITTSLIGLAGVVAFVLKWMYNDKGVAAQAEDEAS
jgi:hypothetical protein